MYILELKVILLHICDQNDLMCLQRVFKKIRENGEFTQDN